VGGLLVNLCWEGKKLGVITDGRPEGQHAKIKSLNLIEYVDEIIITDELAGSSGNVLDFRKPNDIAFTIMRMRLGSTLDNMVYVGDNPAKDFQPSRSLGFDAIHFINPNGVYYKSKLATDEPCVTEETTTPTKNPSVKEKGEK
jgi:putative hydrolase of the HAD superfamily